MLVVKVLSHIFHLRKRSVYTEWDRTQPSSFLAFAGFFERQTLNSFAVAEETADVVSLPALTLQSMRVLGSEAHMSHIKVLG